MFQCAVDSEVGCLKDVQVATLGVRISLEDITNQSDPGEIPSCASPPFIQVVPCQSPPPPPIVPSHLPPSQAPDAPERSLSPPQARGGLPIAQSMRSEAQQDVTMIPGQDCSSEPTVQPPAPAAACRPVARPVDIVRISAGAMTNPACPTPASIAGEMHEQSCAGEVLRRVSPFPASALPPAPSPDAHGQRAEPSHMPQPVWQGASSTCTSSVLPAVAVLCAMASTPSDSAGQDPGAAFATSVLSCHSSFRPLSSPTLYPAMHVPDDDRDCHNTPCVETCLCRPLPIV